MAMLKIDELNVNRKSSVKRAIPYRTYFGEMDLTEEEKDKRIELAKVIEQVFLFLFTVLAVEKAVENEIDAEYYNDMVFRRFVLAVSEQGYDITPELEQYIKEMSKAIVEETVKPANGKTNDPYLTSEDRAMFIAENESNAIRNYLQLEEAIKKGYRRKRWITKHDRKVRHTHELADGETIGIYDMFEIGDSLMMFPKDNMQGADAKEIVNCRCVCKYLK